MEAISKLEVFEDKLGGVAVIQTDEGRYRVKYRRNIFTGDISILKKESTDEDTGIQELNRIIPCKKIKRMDPEKITIRDEFDAVDAYFDYSFISRKLQAPIFNNEKLINKIVKKVKKSQLIDKNEFANRMRRDFIADCIIFNNYKINEEIAWKDLDSILQGLCETEFPTEKEGFAYKLEDLIKIYQIINKLEVAEKSDFSRKRIIRSVTSHIGYLYRVFITASNALVKFGGPVIGLLLAGWLFKNFNNNLNFGVSLLSKLSFSQTAYYIGYKSLVILLQSFILTFMLFIILRGLRSLVNLAFRVLQLTDNYRMFRDRIFRISLIACYFISISLVLAEQQIFHLIVFILSLTLLIPLTIASFAPELFLYRIFTVKSITTVAAIISIVSSINVIWTEFDHNNLSLGKSCGFYYSSDQIKYYQYFITNSWQDKVEIVFLSGSSTEWVSKEPKNINTFYTVPKKEVELLSDCSMVKDFEVFKEGNKNRNPLTKRDCGLVGNAGYIESKGLGSSSQKYLVNPSDGSCVEILQ